MVIGLSQMVDPPSAATPTVGIDLGCPWRGLVHGCPSPSAAKHQSAGARPSDGEESPTPGFPVRPDVNYSKSAPSTRISPSNGVPSFAMTDAAAVLSEASGTPGGGWTRARQPHRPSETKHAPSSRSAVAGEFFRAQPPGLHAVLVLHQQGPRRTRHRRISRHEWGDASPIL